jgi:hypothetical protein
MVQYAIFGSLARYGISPHRSASRLTLLSLRVEPAYNMDIYAARYSESV